MDLTTYSIGDIATALGVSESDLLAVANRAPRSYRVWRMPKKSGGFRTIEEPSADLKELQRKLNDFVLLNLNAHPSLFGHKGTSTVMALRTHTKKPLVITMDIQDFFPSITHLQVLEMFRQRGATREVAHMLARLVTFKGHIPQGSPVSPRIAQLVLHPAITHIAAAITRAMNADCSVWVDDMTLSGPAGLSRMRKTIMAILERHGFHVHPRKIRAMFRNADQISLGIKLNDGLEVPADYRRLYEEELFRLGARHRRVQGIRGYINTVEESAALSS